MATLPRKPLLMICDVQERFRSAIYGFDQMKNTICKMVEVARIDTADPNVDHRAESQRQVSICIARLRINHADVKVELALGATIPEIANLLDSSRHLGTYPKTRFSMVNEDTKSVLDQGASDTFIVTGIESHVCVLQTTLDLLRLPSEPDVYVLSDAISSCNKPEIAIALRRMELAGAKVTTSESMIFELLGDANDVNFKAAAGLIKQEKTKTADALRTLCVEHV
uniref:Isochorismatase-like domain-containing protein n=1 Tax=Kwoniella bestiolae CBS 10118 TaxID=1296100 RepID=A0A1B9FTV7_9TREE|nr:hypothetical protein I302_07852 [Kwoniella bestiolae CBS 10118]OCF22207.1 hypothetical protein I302_07852 [Kwoniella bestiolae CBS 10118]